MDLGDGTRYQGEARGARASDGESGGRGLDGERVRERRRERKGLVVKRRFKSKDTHFSLTLVQVSEMKLLQGNGGLKITVTLCSMSFNYLNKYIFKMIIFYNFDLPLIIIDVLIILILQSTLF